MDFFAKPFLYADAYKLAADLGAEKAVAIRYVMEKVQKSARALAVHQKLNAEVAEEALTDAVMILIRKIQASQFVPDVATPTTYLLEIYKRVLLNAGRKEQKTKDTLLLDETHLQIEDFDTYIDQAAEERVALLLHSLGEPCQQLIRLRFLDEMSDEEVLEKGLTRYTTGVSLRNRRSQCMKLLRERWVLLKMKKD